MRKYIMVVLLVVLFLVTACSSNRIVGKWIDTNEDNIETIFEFKNDGEVLYTNSDGVEVAGTYNLDGDLIIINLEIWSKPIEYKFFIEDEKLTLTSNDDYSPSYINMEKR